MKIVFAIVLVIATVGAVIVFFPQIVSELMSKRKRETLFI